MSRSERLLALLQLLRGHRYAITGSELASQLGISLRTLYRDIATLQAQGAHIEGEAGIGYVLRPGFMLPPLMFSEDEIEALVFGARLAATRADERLASSAENALAKMAAVLPPDLADRLDRRPGLERQPRRRRPVAGARRHPQRDPTRVLLCQREGPRVAPRRLADRGRLLRARARPHRLVRAQDRFPSLPRRPHVGGRRPRRPPARI